MAATVLADTGFLVALLGKRDTQKQWADAISHEYPPPWHTCEAVLSEAFHLVADQGRPALLELLRLEAVNISFSISTDLERVLALMQKYSEIPMSFADACLVRMTEAAANSIVLTTDTDFRVYRRHDRQVIPCAMPV